MMQKVHLRRTSRINAGHLWIFSNELYESPKSIAPGSLVEVFDRQENYLGTGYINPASLISIRLLTRERKAVDREFLKQRISGAIALRKRLFKKPDALRLVFSEGDFLPGLIVDQFGTCIVLQFLTLGMENLRDFIVSIIDELLRPEIMVLRNDSRSRELEGLSLHREVIRGSLESLPMVREDGLCLEVDVLEGQKTGFFLDQKENRKELQDLIHGGRGLDLFCYSGAWSVGLASRGAEITGVDSSERAIHLARRNAGLNSLQDRATFIQEDVFSFVRREIENGEKRYEFIVLDPPAFVKSAGKIREAVRAYRELNAVCMRLLKAGGILATSSCSYHLGREMFLDMLHASGRDAGRDLRLISLRSQDKDHPVLLSMPETEYLKCAFLIVD